ncbi:hypothetical protein BJV74DRAFT_762353 [Russula compacta]|nr:hypothetical protein BJV74DRAFT_762353 [Russula compacta]
MTPPPLPPVQSDVILAIFVHSSLKVPMSDDRFGDGGRLAFLGQRVLRMVIAEILFEKRPMMDAADLEEKLEQALSDDSYNQWVTYYGMREKVACPSNLREDLKRPGETQHLFDAYVGALYIEQGHPTIKAWIRPLVHPEINSNDSTGISAVNPPPPSTPPPPLPGNTLGSGAILALFNQTASQRGVKIEWNAIQSGPGHALTWNVDCIADGITKGQGAGKSKQQAKEEAADEPFKPWVGLVERWDHIAVCTLSTLGVAEELLTRTRKDHQSERCRVGSECVVGMDWMWMDVL